MKEVIQFGRLLHEDDVLDDDEKAEIKKDVDELELEHKSLQEGTAEEMDRSVDMN